MANSNRLKEILRRINGRGYKAYKDIKGIYEFTNFTLEITHVQGDPFASPSSLIATIKLNNTQLTEDTYKTKERRIATCDFLTRLFDKNCKRLSRGLRGTGNSGIISIQKCGQEILERSSAVIDTENKALEFRFYAGLPARGRSVLGKIAEEMFFKEIVDIVYYSTHFDDTTYNNLLKHIKVYGDYCFIKKSLKEKRLVAFIPNGSILPRRSGIDERPPELNKTTIIPFKSPESLLVEFDLPNYGKIHGMGIPEGVTVITGGGFHGKSTLLKAIERGIYGHIPEDGRELVATVENAVKIRAEDGRNIEGVDISFFIKDLPFKKDTKNFSTENASGSTSMAANIVEAIECGAELFLIDEDTSATNFLIRDEKIREIVKKEPITPYIDVAKSLYKDYGISTIIITGGSGDYFDVADRVILMDEYLPYDVTDNAVKHRNRFNKKANIEIKKRVITLPSPQKGKREKIASKGKNSIQFGKSSIDLNLVEQIAEANQTEFIGLVLRFLYMDKTENPTVDKIEHILSKIEKDGFVKYKSGNLALARKYEIMAAINRLRGIRISK
ncbi:ABC transport system ATP-binding protein [Thermotomaculum hydrothermale]|uniref:ABC transport system ATP-binding protein n=1 Tax=Thermotomaculum hydrothermale TaxID=981385 RepID=A0A7R6SYJ9_9BACT|nr:ABC-ATPase domain-containing protein [Thermotomaculum hydrothermale]BBB32641.1 ABC transport system ATP-binding protein [Thermotomaculum hydrothermale]